MTRLVANSGKAALAALALFATAATAASAKPFQLIYSFSGGAGGGTPAGDLVLDRHGALYGTTVVGGDAGGYGVVFKLTPSGKQTVLHSFASGSDGASSYAGLIAANSGDYFGVTSNGGGASGCTGGCGTIFRITSKGKESVPYAFTGGSDGANPDRPLSIDGAGNLLGTTPSGGASGMGVVFSLTQQGQESVLYAFIGGSDGSAPIGGVILDKKGNLYGTTAMGGGSASCSGGCGTVFKVTPQGHESVLHAFGAAGDGQSSYSGLVSDKQGNLYGVTYAGGASGNGIVFKVTRDGQESVLYSFAGGSDGAHPEARLILDKKGNLFGTTANGGGSCNCGTVFELSADGSEHVLHSFIDSDGGYPYGGLTMGAQGEILGTTYSGGTHNYGVVFEVKK